MDRKRQVAIFHSSNDVKSPIKIQSAILRGSPFYTEWNGEPLDGPSSVTKKLEIPRMLSMVFQNFVQMMAG